MGHLRSRQHYYETKYNKDYIDVFLKDMGYVIDCLDNNPYEIKAVKET